MKRRRPPGNLALYLQRHVRLGSRLRRLEPLLRIGQLILFIWLALAGAQVIARALTAGGGALFRMLP